MKFKQDFFKDSDPRVNLVQPDRTLTSWPYCNCKKTFLTKHGGCRCSWLPSPRRLFTNFYKPKPNHNANEIAIKMRNFFNMNFGVAINQNRANYQVKKLYQTISNPDIFFSQSGFLPPNKQIEPHPPPPFSQPPSQAQPGNPNMFNPALYNPTMAAVAAEQQSRFYSQIYRTMAIAAVHQQQQQQLGQHPHGGGPVGPKPPPVLPPPSGPPPQSRDSNQSRPKRRRTSAGNDPSAPPSHLSGEMIRRLREKQKMKNAAAVASAVASVAAVTTSGGRQFDKPQMSPSSTNSVALAGWVNFLSLACFKIGCTEYKNLKKNI